MDVSGRMSTWDQRPLHLPQEQEGSVTSRQDVCFQEICSSVWGQFSVHFSMHRLARSVSDYFVTVWEQLSVCFHSSLFLRLVLLLTVSEKSVCSMEGSLLALVLGAKFFFRSESQYRWAFFLLLSSCSGISWNCVRFLTSGIALPVCGLETDGNAVPLS